MIELFAAVIGACVGVAGISATSLGKRNGETRDLAVRLAAGVENIGLKLDSLHADMREDRRILYSRIGDLEQRVSKLEVKS